MRTRERTAYTNPPVWKAAGQHALQQEREILRALLSCSSCLLSARLGLDTAFSRAAVGLSQPSQGMGEAEQCLLCSADLGLKTQSDGVQSRARGWGLT